MKNSVLFLWIFFLFGFSYGLNAQQPCDTLLLKTGEYLLIHDIKMFNKTIRFKKCGEPEYKSHTILKSLYSSIAYFDYSTRDTIRQFEKPMYSVWIDTKKQKLPVTGYLHSFQGTSMQLGPYHLRGKPPKEVMIQDIENFKIRKHNSVIKGIAIGAVSGLIAGIIIVHTTKEGSGSSSYSSSSHKIRIPDYSGLLTCAAGAAAGGLIGGLIGSIRIEVPINGQVPVYQDGVRPFLY